MPALNLRTGPGSKYRSIGLLRENDFISIGDIKEERGPWVRIEIERGWVDRDALSSGPISFFRSRRSAKRLTLISKGEVGKILDSESDDGRVEVRLKNVISGWLHKGYTRERIAHTGQTNPKPSWGPDLLPVRAPRPPLPLPPLATETGEKVGSRVEVSGAAPEPSSGTTARSSVPADNAKLSRFEIQVRNATEDTVTVWIHFLALDSSDWITKAYRVPPSGNSVLLTGASTKNRFIYLRAMSESGVWIPDGESATVSVDGESATFGKFDLGKNFGVRNWTVGR